MANQYEVLGKAPGSDDLKKLSSSNLHLRIKDLNAGYGKMEILHNFDLFVSKGQSLCLIGPNGAGKSTILHSIYGFTNIFSGKVEIDGKEITNLSPAEKLKSVGIAYILQDNSVFPDMTVEENLLMGGFIKDKTEESYEEAEKILQKYERLGNRRNQPAKVLSGGERRLLET
jgi:branched-chain amino acid transport system ATP-binding protein